MCSMDITIMIYTTVHYNILFLQTNLWLEAEIQDRLRISACWSSLRATRVMEEANCTIHSKPSTTMY